MYSQLIFVILAVFLIAGCVEMNPHQDKIDSIEKEILTSGACAVESDGVCIKYKN